MRGNQARLIRFHLGFTGWQTYGPQSRPAAVTLADWGILERGGDNGRQFRLALADDVRRALDAAPAMLAALQEAVARVQVANAEGDSILSAWLPDALAAIAAATGAPTGETAAPTVGISAGGYTLENGPDGEGFTLERDGVRRYLSAGALAAAFGMLDSDPAAATGER